MPALLPPQTHEDWDESILPDLLPTIHLVETTLDVADLAAAERFYHDVLGFEVLERWDEDRPAACLALGRQSFLELRSREAGDTAPLRATTIRVPAGALDWYEARFQGLGMPYERIACDDGSPALYVADPDGNVLDLSD